MYLCLWFSFTQIKLASPSHTHTHTLTETHTPLKSLPSLFSQYQMAGAESICQTNCWRTLAFTSPDHSFIWTHTRPLVPDLLSPLILSLLLLHLPFPSSSSSSSSSSSCPFLLSSSRSVITCSSVVSGDGGIDPWLEVRGHLLPPHLVHAFTRSLLNTCELCTLVKPRRT